MVARMEEKRRFWIRVLSGTVEEEFFLVNSTAAEGHRGKYRWFWFQLILSVVEEPLQ